MKVTVFKKSFGFIWPVTSLHEHSTRDDSLKNLTFHGSRDRERTFYESMFDCHLSLFDCEAQYSSMKEKKE